MAIGPVELNGTISRMQDYSTIRQNEDNQGALTQHVAQNRLEKEIDERHTQVTRGDDIGRENRKFDAREKGDNEYAGDGGARRRNNQGKNQDGKVIVRRESFDMKI